MKHPLLLVTALSALLAACGGGEESAPLATPGYRVDVTLPAAGTLCADLDQNWRCDPGEPAVSGEGRLTLTGQSTHIVNSPLLFIPRAGGLPLAHPAARGDQLHLQPTLLSSLWQSRIAEGIAVDSALTQLLAALAPLQPGTGREALNALPQFDQALQQLAISLLQAAQLPLSGSKGHLQLATGYRTLNLMLAELAQAWQQDGRFADDTLPRLLALLAQQQPRDLLTVTGVTTFSDGRDPLLAHEPTDFPGQDAHWNRTRPQLAYRKLDDKGQELADNASSWQCVKDLNTGLVWEVKSDDPLSPAWKGKPFAYEDEQFTATTGEQAAARLHILPLIERFTADGDQESLARAQRLTTLVTSRAYQQWLNGEQRCGITRWRLPTMAELMSLMHYGSLATDAMGQNITLDQRYFPDVASSAEEAYPGYYWSATSTTAQRLSGGPVSKRTAVFLQQGADAGTTYPAMIQQEDYPELMQLRLVATPN
ncbi:DUF1566 domain-containing protein [Aeromonas enteropelogenes]|uniref:DUF1566 domain-containing protein n=1 Tax=Aeromonas enteropelogenes TaxID=29489 RepID=A0ABU9J9K6_AEREN